MKRIHNILLSMTIMLALNLSVAQEQEIDVEESAEVFLEEYSDSFQESFFEALKQKGIENYDKAINLLLECKLIDAHSHVVDHELAKVYHVDKQYLKAEEFAIAALLSEPENLWYLNTLVIISQKQGSSVENISSQIPFDNNKLKENLALIYYRQSNFDEALKILNNTKMSSFTNELASKISDSINKKQSSISKNKPPVKEIVEANPLEELKGRIAILINTNDLESLTELSSEALENYPSQPYFYYANGHALNKKGKYKDAAEILEAALDYMLDDVPLLNKIYQELVDAYNALSNSSKANMYLRKIKPGF